MAQPVDDTWRSLVGKPNQAVGRVDLLDRTGAVVRSTADGQNPLRVDDARGVSDRTRAVRGSADVVLLSTVPHGAQEPLVPTTATALLSPLGGSRFRLWAGFRYPDRVDHVVPVGTYMVTDPVVNESASGLTITIAGSDPSHQVSAARFDAPTEVSPGINYVTAIVDLVKVADPFVQVITPGTPHTTPLLTFDEQADRWEAVRKMADSIGMEVFYDALGRLVIQPAPTMTGDPTWTFDWALATPLIKVTNAMDSRDVFSGVRVRGENMSEGPPVSATVWDTDPLSPTYYDPANPSASAIGPRPFFYASEFIKTEAQALDAARERLPKVNSLRQRVEVEVPYNPAVEAGDVIYVDSPSTGVVGKFLVERRPVALKGATMVLTCQERRVGA